MPRNSSPLRYVDPTIARRAAGAAAARLVGGRGARDDAADEARFAHGEAAAWLQFSIFRVPRRAVEELVREAAAPERVSTAWIAGYHDHQTWLLVTFDEAAAADVRGAGAADLRRLNTTNNI